MNDLKIKNIKLNEGIEFNTETKTVKFIPNREDYVDTSELNNPTYDDSIYPVYQSLVDI